MLQSKFTQRLKSTQSFYLIRGRMLSFLSKVFLILFSLGVSQFSYCHEREIDIKSGVLNFAMSQMQLSSKKVTTPLYKTTTLYEGFDLVELLNQAKITAPNKEVLVFRAKDGFKINIPFSFIKKYKPFLAIRDASLSGELKWVSTRDGGRVVDGGPFYLMWPNRTCEVPENYWAFGVVKMFFLSFKEAYGNSAPPPFSSNAVLKGFHIFQSSCAACHSVNLSGGHFGIEMNVPLNFTEYLDKKFIVDYALAPQDFRANANMPAQSFLTRQEIKLVVSYLTTMKKNKICHSQKECKVLLEKK